MRGVGEVADRCKPTAAMSLPPPVAKNGQSPVRYYNHRLTQSVAAPSGHPAQTIKLVDEI
jgi:hypothetical protein